MQIQQDLAFAAIDQEKEFAKQGLHPLAGIQFDVSDLQTQIGNLAPNTFVTLTLPNGAVSTTPQVTGTLQKLMQAIVNIDPSIYDEFETLVTT